jgi:hypothetical protein
MHVFIAPVHFQIHPAHAIFFALIGMAQLGWAFLMGQRPSRAAVRTGIALSGGMILLWIVTQIFGSPFTATAEALDLSTLIINLSELISLSIIITLGRNGTLFGIGKFVTARLIVEITLISILVGYGLFCLGQVAAPYLP